MAFQVHFHKTYNSCQLREEYQNNSDNDEECSYESPLTEEEAKLAELLGVLIVEIVVAASPYVCKWWCEIAFPGIKDTFSNIKKVVKDKFKKKDKKDSETEEIVVAAEVIETTELACSPQMLATKINEAYDEYKVDMTSDEAKRNLLEIAMLANLLAKRINLMQQANIKDPEWKSLETLITSEGLIDNANQILLESSELAFEDLVTGIEALLGRGIHKEVGGYLPISTNEIRNALDRGEEEPSTTALLAD